MTRTLMLLALVLSAGIEAFEPEDYAWRWTLETDVEAPGYRVRLAPEVYASLAGDGLRELMVTDANDQPVPFAVISGEFLVEPLSRRIPMTFEVAPDDENAETADGERAPLEIQLEHGDTRLVLTTPRSDALPAGEQLVLEALIAAPEVSDEMPERSLVLRLASETPARFDCRVRDADNPDAREVALRVAGEGDSHPYHYTASRDTGVLPQGWHLRCFSPTVGHELSLLQAHLYARGRRDHARTHRLRPEMVPDDDGYRLELPGPLRIDTFEIAADEANLLADIAIFSRDRTNQPWVRRGEGVLSTLPAEDEQPARVALRSASRDRLWRLEVTPPPSTMPEVTLEAPVEELLFLAQGESPWRLYAGTHAPAETAAPQDLVAQTRQRLGTPWTWPVAVTAERRESGGPDALKPPPEPIPWRRWLLWAVLIAGAALLIWQSVRLLRQAP